MLLVPVAAIRQSSRPRGHFGGATQIMTDALVLNGVTKRFGTFTAVDDLSLTVPTGCIYGFLGQNGAGKTTTLRLLAGLLRPSAGTMSIAGLSHATRSRELKRQLGFVPDTPPLGLMMPISMRMVVVLPAPFWPRKP